MTQARTGKKHVNLWLSPAEMRAIRLYAIHKTDGERTSDERAAYEMFRAGLEAISDEFEYVRHALQGASV